MDDADDVQEILLENFHFLWLLILILFTTWTPPLDYRSMDIPVEFLGTQFQTIWDHKDSKRKADTKLAFFLQGERLRQIARQQCRMFPTMMAKYPFINFYVGPHNILSHMRNDPKKQVLSTFFIIKDVDIEREIKYCPKEWLSQRVEVPAE